MVVAATIFAHHRRRKKEAEQAGHGHSRLVARVSTRQRLISAAAAARGDGFLARAMELLESLAMQTMLYMAFVLIFQMLANSLRDPQEYHVDIRLMEDFVQENSPAHNTFESRRFADVRMGNQVLWPSLFANIEPCNPASVGSRAPDLQRPPGQMAGAFGSQGVVVQRQRAGAANGHSRLDGGRVYPDARGPGAVS